jgi:hypothetical protein
MAKILKLQRLDVENGTIYPMEESWSITSCDSGSCNG